MSLRRSGNVMINQMAPALETIASEFPTTIPAPNIDNGHFHRYASNPVATFDAATEDRMMPNDVIEDPTRNRLLMVAHVRTTAVANSHGRDIYLYSAPWGHPTGPWTRLNPHATPLVPRGSAGRWDSGSVYGAGICIVGNRLHIAYHGCRDTGTYATSPLYIGLAYADLTGNEATTPIQATKLNTLAPLAIGAGTMSFSDLLTGMNKDLAVTFSDSAGDLLCTASGNHGLTAANDGAPLYFTTTGTLPANLTVGQAYYFKYVGANTYKVEAVVGGGAIAYSATNGSGTHTSQMGHFGNQPNLHWLNGKFYLWVRQYTDAASGSTSLTPDIPRLFTCASFSGTGSSWLCNDMMRPYGGYSMYDATSNKDTAVYMLPLDASGASWLGMNNNEADPSCNIFTVEFHPNHILYSKLGRSLVRAETESGWCGTTKTVTVTNATNTINCVGHGYTAGQSITLISSNGDAGYPAIAGTAATHAQCLARVFVTTAGLNADDFQVSATGAGDAAIDFTSDGTGTITANTGYTDEHVPLYHQGKWYMFYAGFLDGSIVGAQVGVAEYDFDTQDVIGDTLAVNRYCSRFSFSLAMTSYITGGVTATVTGANSLQVPTGKIRAITINPPAGSAFDFVAPPVAGWTASAAFATTFKVEAYNKSDGAQASSGANCGSPICTVHAYAV